MKPTPPHLPPKTTETHIISTSLLALFVGLFAGAAMALVVNVWLMPSIAPDGIVSAGRGFEPSRSVLPDRTVMTAFGERTMTVYDTRGKAGMLGYRIGAWQARGIVLSSDGWVVLYDPTYEKGKERYWEVIDVHGEVKRITQTTYDSITGFVYFRLSGDTVLPVIELADIEFALHNTQVPLWYVDADTWQLIELGQPVGPMAPIRHPLWAPVYQYDLSPKPERGGGMVVTNDGRVVGFVAADGRVCDAFEVKAQVGPILTSGSVAYEGIPVEGYVVTPLWNGTEWEQRAGFYVAKTNGVRGVRVGDVIVALQGQPIVPPELSKQLLTGPTEMSLTIFRAKNTAVTQETVAVKKSTVP